MSIKEAMENNLAQSKKLSEILSWFLIAEPELQTVQNVAGMMLAALESHRIILPCEYGNRSTIYSAREALTSVLSSKSNSDLDSLVAFHVTDLSNGKRSAVLVGDSYIRADGFAVYISSLYSALSVDLPQEWLDILSKHWPVCLNALQHEPAQPPDKDDLKLDTALKNLGATVLSLAEQGGSRTGSSDNPNITQIYERHIAKIAEEKRIKGLGQTSFHKYAKKGLSLLDK